MLITLHERLADRLATEIEDLAFEVFCTTYGADWQQSIETALAELPALIDYADDWDFDAECLALEVR